MYPWNKGRKLGTYSLERREHIRNSLLGKKLSKEHRNSIKKGLFNFYLSHSHKPMTEETKRKISDKLKYRYENNLIVNNRKGKKLSLKSRKLISKNRKGKCTGESNPSKRQEVRIKIGLKHKNKKLSEETKSKIRQKRLRQIIPLRDTSIEIKVQEALKQRKIKFEKHKFILGQPDIFIEPNICVFCDGNYWHNRDYVVKKDEYVNFNLRKMGYNVIRLWEKEINSNIDESIDKILCQISK